MSFSHHVETGSGGSHPLNQWVVEAVSPGIKLPESESDYAFHILSRIIT